MAWAYFKMQLRLLLTRKKNWLMIGLAMAAMVVFCAYGNQATQPREKINTRIIKIDRAAINAELARAGKNGAAKYPGLASRSRSETLLLQALKSNQRKKLLQGIQWELARQGDYWYNADDYSYPVQYYQARSATDDPRADGHFYNLKMIKRITAYQHHPQQKFNQAVYNEQTFLQTMARVCRRWLPLSLIMLILALANDVYTADLAHASVGWGAPLAASKRLVLKSLAVLTVAFTLVLVFVAMVAVTTLPRFGLGLGAGVARHVGRHYAFTMVTLGWYFGWVTLLCVLLSWCWVRLSLALQLLLHNEYATLLLSLGLLATPALYFQRGVAASVPRVLAYLPTYTEAGQLVDGTQNFLYDAAQLTPTWATLVLMAWLVAIELILAALTRLQQRRGWLA